MRNEYKDFLAMAILAAFIFCVGSVVGCLGGLALVYHNR